MLKLIPVAFGLVAAIPFAQPSLAMTTPSIAANPVVSQPVSNLQAQLVINIGNPLPSPSSREIEHRRYLESLERQRQTERERWEATHRNHSERDGLQIIIK